MRLENVIALTHATLLNSPYVTAFSGLSYEAKSVKRGYLFIAKDSSEIELAILNGAYGILFDSPMQMIDSEIAWIKVDELATALLKILRFHILDKNITAYECDKITLDLASQISTQDRFKALNGDIYDTFKDLWEITPNSVVLFTHTFTCKDIFTHPKEMPKSTDFKISIIEQTLFETSFIYDDIYYERQALSVFFIPYLEILLSLFKEEKIDFKIVSFKHLSHFEPVFTNKNFEIKEFGTSDKVLIFEPNFEFIESQITFLQNQANWAKLIYILPIEKITDTQRVENVYTYTIQQDIISILKSTDFHFALIAEQNKTLLEKSFFTKKTQQLTLEF
jgi:ferrochelatase